MARNDIQTTTIDLRVSASQARQTLKLLENDTARLRREMEKAASAGDTRQASNLQRQINNNLAVMRRMRTETAAAAEVLHRLDNASPKELKKTLATLQRQLGNMRAGTEEFRRQAGEIRRVRSALDSVNAQLRQQPTLWQKLKSSLGGILPAASLAAMATTAVASTRKAVDAFREVEQEMAGVKKYSGLSSEGVAALNKEFKKLDTRTARADLNRLAQDAGRLGKQSVDEILGFVKAADQINVALDDLGDGATLTLSKLTGIFGVEKQYGTEQSLLKVGSVINELSQNCSASAPFIAEFTSRMGGVGAQAKMSIPQIMAFGAVLDTQQAGLESSSTALGQVIVKMYREPAKYARAAGMDVKAFTTLMKKDANEALLQFLETLNKAGNMDALAPMFAHMGENGSRSIQTLSSLAKHIDEVRAQQEAANQAFDEGKSITNEFNVANDTASARLEKIRNQLREMWISLGAQLMPAVEVIGKSAIMSSKTPRPAYS